MGRLTKERPSFDSQISVFVANNGRCVADQYQFHNNYLKSFPVSPAWFNQFPSGKASFDQSSSSLFGEPSLSYSARPNCPLLKRVSLGLVCGVKIKPLFSLAIAKNYPFPIYKL
jgi:hypothetical protein